MKIERAGSNEEARLAHAEASGEGAGAGGVVGEHESGEIGGKALKRVLVVVQARIYELEPFRELALLL